VRFLVDADLPPLVAAVLQAAGHDCEYVPDVFPPRTPDSLVAARAREVRSCIVTRDFGFADIRQYVPSQHHGIVVLTVPPDAGSRYIVDLIRELLDRMGEFEPIPGKLLIVEPGRIRVRE
jgi:predicted nuclease of predicted toxin-antitoxin system